MDIPTYLWQIKAMGTWRWSKWVSILTFPGFVAFVGFCLLRSGLYFSSDVLTDQHGLYHIHLSAAVFGYVLVPLFFVFALRLTGRINTIEMPLIADRRWGFLGAIFGAFTMVIHTQWDAPERANRWQKNISQMASNLGVDFRLKPQASASVDVVNDAMIMMETELQRYAWVVFSTLLILYIGIYFGKKWSIHLSAISAISYTVFCSLYRICNAVPSTDCHHKTLTVWYKELFSNPTQMGVVVFLMLCFWALVFLARKQEKAHTNHELILGSVVGLLCATCFGIL